MRFSNLATWWSRLWRRKWPKSRKVMRPTLSRADRQVLYASLTDHIGWQCIMASLENRKASIESRREVLVHNIKLTTPAEPLIRELIRLDEAIYWLGSIQHTIKRTGAMPALTDAPDEQSL